jgi:phospholipid/cholesterol/gamma-HCH transport system substrate-binding protein
VPGQLITGVETSMFDPIIEQVGLGPVERGHLSHTIAEVRQTIDSIAPRIKHMLGSLQETTSNLREMSDSIRPAVESTVDHVEDMTRKLNDNSPRIENIIKLAEELAGQAQGYLADNRENVKQSMISTRDLLASVNDIVIKDRSKVERVLDGVEVSRARADRVLYQADQIAGQLLNTLARSRSEVERSVTNVRDATDWANKLVQKIYTNPFVLSPFYKPNHEDLRVGTVYDTALEFTKGAQELRDTVKTIEAMAARPATQQQQQELFQLQQKASMLTERLGATSTQLAEALKRSGGNGRDQRTR